MSDPRPYVSRDDRGTRGLIFGEMVVGKDDAEFAAKFDAMIAPVEKRLKRPLTRTEVLRGLERVAKVNPTLKPKEQDAVKAEARRRANLNAHRRRTELHPPAPPKSAEEHRLAEAEKNLKAMRRSKLSPEERAVEDAREALAAREAADLENARREAVLTSPPVQRLLAGLTQAIVAGRTDPTVDAEHLAELEHQRELVLRHATVGIAEAVGSNFKKIQAAIAAGLDAEAAELRSALEVISNSRRALTTSPDAFDSVREVMVGASRYVELKKGDVTKTISSARFESRDSDEALAQQIFTTKETTNV